MVAVSEEFTTLTLLGIRFWDPALDRFVDDSLQVTARPFDRPQKKVHALRTPSGVYSFPRLPGMRAFEYGYESDDTNESPVNPHEFVIEISDTRKRFVSVAMSVDLPLDYTGVFLSNSINSPSSEKPKGLHLYSSVTRDLPSNLATVRGQLKLHNNRVPAAHALLRLQAESGDSWFGIADEQGSFAIVFPYPPLEEGFAGSPLSDSAGSLYEQTWNLELSIFYSPSTQQLLPETDVPNYLSILSQSAADIWPLPASDGGSSVSQLPITLEYHQTAVIKTDGQSELLISP